MSIIKGNPSQEHRADSNQRAVTVQPVKNGGYALDTTAQSTAAIVASDLAEAGSTTQIINATAHVAEAGDIIRFTSGATIFPREVNVESVTTNTIILAKPLPTAPATSDPFDIMRYFNETVSLTGSPFSQVAFDRDGSNQIVTEDTGAPANNRPLPTTGFANDGTPLASGAGVVSAGTRRTTPASDSPHLLATRHEAVGTPLSSRLSDGTDFLSSEAITAAQESIASVTKALATASFTFGWDGTNHRELLLDSGGRALLSTRHEAVTTPLAARLTDGTDFISAEAIAASQKTVATTTKSITAVGLALGWDGVTHRELAVDTSGRATLSTRHEAVGTPLAGRLSDGTNFIGSEALAGSQKTLASETAMLSVLSVGLGWDGTTHREIALETSGAIKTSPGTTAATFPARGKISGTALTGTYANIFTAASDLRVLFVYNTCDQPILVSLDAGVTDHFEFDAREGTAIDFTQNGRHLANTTDIRVKHAGVVPTDGSIRISAVG